jgi:hypothetical protein
MGSVVSITTRPRFTPGERAPGTHWTGGWVGLRTSLDAEARKKILCLYLGSKPGRPVRSQPLYWLSYPGSWFLWRASWDRGWRCSILPPMEDFSPFCIEKTLDEIAGHVKNASKLQDGSHLLETRTDKVGISNRISWVHTLCCLRSTKHSAQQGLSSSAPR